MGGKKVLKSFPEFKSDAEAERFVEEADLPEYDLSVFGLARFQFTKASAEPGDAEPRRSTGSDANLPKRRR